MSKAKLVTVCVSIMILATLVPSLAASAESVKIEFMTPLWNEQVKSWYETDVIPGFQELYPGIMVEVIYVTWNEYDDKRLVTTASGIGPDSWLVPSTQALVQGYKGQIIPLDRFAEQYRNELKLGEFLPQAIASQTLNGRLYALPNTVNVRTYATSIALFEQVGMNPRAPLGDWNSFPRLVGKLTGAYDYSEKNSFKVPNLSQYWGGVLLEAGFRWLSDDWELRMSSPEGIALIDYINTLHDAGGRSPAMWTGGGLYNETTAMAFIEIQNLIGADKALGGGAYVLPEPVNRSAVMPITGLGISAASKNTEAAWKWIMFQAGAENLSRFNSFYGRIPPRVTAMRTPEIMNDSLLRQSADIASRYAKYEPLMNPYSLDAASTATARLKEMFNGVVHPSQVIADIQRAWDTKLAEVKAEQKK